MTDTPATSDVLGDADGLALLRTSTDAAHRDLEAATGLPGSLAGAADVAGLLVRWHGLAAALESAAGPWGRPSLRAAVAADLHDLGAAPGAVRVLDRSRVRGEAGRLGVAWVLHGARLGLRTLDPTVRRLTGRRLRSTAGVDHATLAGIRMAIGALPDPEVACEAASAAFDLAARELVGPPWTP